MKRCYVMLVVLLAVAVSAQAELVPNGDFAMYKPGTGYTVSATFNAGDNVWTTGMGDGVTVNNELVNYGDGTTGNLVDVPGWITPIESPNGAGMAGHADLFTLGYDETDGTSCLNAFGAWSSQNGTLAMSAASLAIPAGPVTISAMFQGDPLPLMFDLFVDGVALVPDAATNPADAGDGSWRELTRTYNSVPAGDARIILGTPKPLDPGTGANPGVDRLYGTRLKIDNVSIVPEPVTMALLGLGGLFLRRRRNA